MIRSHAARHILLTTALVVSVCAAIALLSLSAYRTANASLAALTEVAQGTVTPLSDDRVRVDWLSASGAPLSTEITLAVAPPTEPVPASIAYNPQTPTQAVIPGATVFADADRALGGMALAALVTLLSLSWVTWLAVSRTLLRRRPTTRLAVRRVRIQRGLLTRSYLETEHAPHRWIPVYFDPLLQSLPTPTEVEVHGNPTKNALVAVTVAGTPLHPSGRVRTTEPLGRRTDNPAHPDPPHPNHLPTLPRHLRTDAPATLTAPLLGLFWAFVDGSAFPGWLAATTTTATLALWLWSTQGSDPTT